MNNHVSAHKLSRASYRHYRNSIAYTLAEAEGADAAVLFNRHCRTNIEPPKNTKKQYRKRVPEKVVSSLIKLAAQHDLASYRFIARLVFCMYYTGVRPGEWRSAKYDPATGILTVQNSKYKSTGNLKRGNGQERWLDVKGQSNKSLEANIIKLISEMNGVSWESRQGYASRTLKKMLAALIAEKTITTWWRKLRIYDFRHQCCANLKAKYPQQPSMVAAMMGHYSTTTAYVHYGQRRHGKASNSIVAPTKESEFLVSRASLDRLRRRMAPSRERKPLSVELRGTNLNMVQKQLENEISLPLPKTDSGFSPG
ncbi:hypothetical protein OIV19_18315 [Brucella sp. HL-2]|nr:hypothetical protein [Brucella sp. HL-2]MCV9909558.1 hypothetical protein [Brucella sp. HL-2]